MTSGELVPDTPRAMIFQKDIDQTQVGPERYELARALRDLAPRLGVSLSRYAVRIFLDRSTLSRYFSGTVVPPASFVERLVEDGDRATGTDLTAEARKLVRELHRAALRATSPGSADLQDLRDKLAAADQESHHLQQEALLLRDMLIRVQEQLDEQKTRIRQVERASAASRLAHRTELEQQSAGSEALRTERDELLQKIARLRAELEKAELRARTAEGRCALLEQQLEAAEGQAEEAETPTQEVIEYLATFTRENRIFRDLQLEPGDGDQSWGGGIIKLLGSALGSRIEKSLYSPSPAPLTEAAVLNLPEKPGAFQLIRRSADGSDVCVYLGKDEHSLRRRLTKLRQKIRGRKNLSSSEIFFNYLHIEDDLSTFAVDKILLQNWNARNGELPPWNKNDFGAMDAGRARDHSSLAPHHFDALHPIDLTWTVYDHQHPAGWKSEWQIIRRLKSALPYTFRTLGDQRYFDAGMIMIPGGSLTADTAFRLLAQALGPEWQISALAGRVILHVERVEYPSAIRYYRGFEVEDGPYADA
ncbi:helix-turn-helix domain-containing protein [Streptomyces sp. NPDC006798]|uniref:helix-turn-helix domain-containing protein n=1 Tax=Streptomyces sp. NPDC006798 TaxID=3155462 RepID=UPI0033DC33D2